MPSLSVLPVPFPLTTIPYQKLLGRALEGAGDCRILSLPPSTGALARVRGPRILHVHWLWLGRRRLRKLRRYVGFRRLLAAASRRGWKIVWTAHNELPHEVDLLDLRLGRALVRRCDGIIAHSEATATSLRAHFRPDCPVAVIPHGHLRDAYGAPPARRDARRRLGLDPQTPVILAFGSVRPYKGFDCLLTAFRKANPRAALIVAGEPVDPEYCASLRALAGGDARVRLELRYIPDAEVPAFFGAADWVALPFRRITTSGTLHLALGFGCPVIIPRIPALTEAAGEQAAEIYEAEDLAAALGRALERDADAASEAARKRADQLGWEPIGRATLAFFRQIAGAGS